MNKPEVGDFIKCHDKADMANVTMELLELGYDVGFVYERDGVRGYWLEVTEVPNEEIHSGDQ